MLHATNDQAPARHQHKKRDADAFAADIRARQAAPAVEQTGSDDIARTADNSAANTAARAQPQHDDGYHGDTHANDDQIIARAREAAERLTAGQEWSDWRAFGAALKIGRSHALYEAGTNKPEGKKYASSFACWLTEHKLDQIADKMTRCRLLDLMDHIDQVETWRKTLPFNKRLSINHPITVWKHWQRTKAPRLPDQNKAPSPVAKLKESVATLSEENARLKEANGGNLFTARDRPQDVVRILRETFSTSKFNEIRRLMKDDEPAC